MRNQYFSPYSPNALFSLFIFLFLVPIQARNQALRETCSSSCGDIEKISYPFRLKGDPAYCGDPDYELYCENNQTILNFHDGLYHVKRISYDERTIRLVDVNFAGVSCSLPYRSLGIAEVLGDGRYNSKYVHSHATYVRCSEEIKNMANYTVPCLMTRNKIDDKLNFPSNYEAIQEIMQLGIDLNWTVECRDCVESGGYCQFPSDQLRSFRCNKEEDYATQLRNAVLYLLAMFLVGLIPFSRFILAPIAVFAFIIHKCLSRRRVDKQENCDSQL